MINLPIEIGDLVLGGRFKNKKIIVKEIGYDEYGSPTINGRSILKVRIPKLYQNRKVNETLDQRQVRVSLIKTDAGDWILYDDSKDQNIDSQRFKTKDEARVYANDHAYKIINIQENRMTAKQMKDRMLSGIESDGSAFELGGAYGNYELWANGNRLEAGSMKDVYNAWIKNRFNPKYAKKVSESKLRKEGNWNRTLKVKVKKEGDRYYNYLVKEDDEDECLTPVGFETKELAKHAAMTKGYIVDEKMYEDEQETSEPMKPTKREKTPGTEKPKEEKLSKGTELKLEGLIRKVIKEEISNNILWSGNGWTLKKYKNKKGTNSISVENKSGFIDYPIKYDSGQIAYDYPEKIPSKIKNMVEKYYQSILESVNKEFFKEEIKKKKGLSEANLSDKPELEAKARRYAELAQKMKLLEAELKDIEKEYTGLDEEFREMLESVSKTKDTFIRAGKLLIKIERAGYDKTSKSYKTGFEYLYGKVNGTMKDLADEALKMTEGVSYVKSKISVVEEGRLVEGWVDKIKNFLKKLTNKIFGLNNKANKELDVLERAL